MTQNSHYEIDHINRKITLSKKFSKAASILNTPEYKEMLQLRRDLPDFSYDVREIKKKSGKKSYTNLTYDNMKAFIAAKDGKDSIAIKQLDDVIKLSKIQAGPYAYVKTWFLTKYADYSAAIVEETPVSNIVPLKQ